MKGGNQTFRYIKSLIRKNGEWKKINLEIVWGEKSSLKNTCPLLPLGTAPPPPLPFQTPQGRVVSVCV